MLFKKIINKISSFKQVPFYYRIRLCCYYFSKHFHLPYLKREANLNIFLSTYLIPHNAFLVTDKSNSYTIKYAFSNTGCYKLTLRKYPSSDFSVHKQIFIEEEYLPLVELIKESYSPTNGLNIIDAGGNIGATSIYLNNIFPNSKFVIIEPEEDNFAYLKENIEQNNLDNYKLVKGGVWSKSCYLELRRDFRDKNDWSVQVVEAKMQTDLIGYDILTLMQLKNFEVVDILKIDIEGAEKQLFDNSSSVSAFLARTRFVAIEIHDEYDCRNKIYDCLRQNGFVSFTAGELTIGANKNLVPNVSTFFPSISILADKS